MFSKKNIIDVLYIILFMTTILVGSKNIDDFGTVQNTASASFVSQVTKAAALTANPQRTVGGMNLTMQRVANQTVHLEANCFYDSVQNMVERLDCSVRYYLNLCSLKDKPRLALLVDIANKLGYAEGFSSSNTNVSECVKDSIITLDEYEDLKLNVYLSELKKSIDAGANTDKIVERVWLAIGDELDDIVRKFNYPFFLRRNMMILLQNIRMVNTLESKYSANLTQCLPNTWENIINVYEISTNSNFIGIYKPHKQICKVDAQVIAIEPELFNMGGIAITFWGTENLGNLKNTTKNVFSGYLSNKLLYEYTLIPQQDQVLHQIKILDKSILIKSNSHCSDYFFVVLSIQKTCDKYMLIYSVRFLASNTRQSGQMEIFADKIENANLIFDKVITSANNLYRNFLYTPEKELLLMSYSVDSNLLADMKKKAICMPNCDYSDAGKCLVCPRHLVNQDGKCLDKCLDNHYVDMGICKPCAIQCKGCTGPKNGDCIECAMKLLNNNGMCVPSCPENMAPNARGRCVKCDPTDKCKVCKNENTCAKCIPDYFLKNGKCEANCGSGYFKSYQPNECSKCKNGCKECGSLNKCDECEKGFFMKNGLCVPNCGDSFFGDVANKKCIACSKGCKVCPNGGKCTVCEAGLLLSAEGCVSKCSKGSVEIKGVCVPCTDKNCDLCLTTDTSVCRTCSDSTFLKNGKCVDVCGDHFYTDKNRECQACTKGCQICTSEKCLKCDTPLVIFKDTQCLAECVEGYVKSGNVCVKCTESSCKRCNPQMLDVCTVCYADNFLLAGKCVPSCPTKMFVDGLNCEECSKGCEKCDNATSCKVCSADFMLKNSRCVDCCGSGFAEVGRECQECKVSGCDICIGSNLDKCEKCVDKRILYNNQCLKGCPLGTFQNTAGGCDECAHDCAICTNKDTCEQCRVGKFLQGKNCQSQCDDTFVSVNGKCTQCLNSRCKKCDTGLTKCTECRVPSLLYKGDCLAVCPFGSYELNGTCMDCVKPCVECSKADVCSSCMKGFFLVDEHCIDHCPDYQGSSEGLCKPCGQKECFKCGSDLNTCLECAAPSVLHNGKCLPGCPSGFYKLLNECKPCVAGCKSCKDSLTCSECNDKLFLKDGKCVPSCGQGYISNLKTKTCVQCNKKCKNCSNDDVNYCTECQVPYFLYQGDCKPSCPNMTYATEKKTCELCKTKNCNKCTGGLTCTECIIGTLLEENKCIPAPCSLGYVQKIDQNVCLECEVDHCERCNPKDLKTCDKCSDLLYLVGNNSCSPDCPVGTFKNNATFKCEPCSFKCNVCSNDKQCNECERNYFLLNGKCEKTCPDGYAPTEGKCAPCEIAGCKNCPTTKVCLLCEGTKVLDNKKCIPECPQRKFNNAGTCQDCQSGCEDCCDNKSCDKCVTGKILNDGKCLDSCPINSVLIKDKCVVCQTEKNCMKCSDKDVTSCVICSKGLVLKNGKCVDKCGDSFFNEGGVCKPCSLRCKTCSDANSCQVCDNGFLLNDNVCVPKCPTGKYPFLGKCIKCSDRCAVCDSNKCLKCDKGSFLENDKCVPHCSKGSYEDVDTCKECSCDCAECISKDTCTLCNPGKVLKNGQCEDDCGLGYVAKSGVCVSCDVNCNKCSALNPKQCTECKAKFVLYDGKCRDKCPITTYLLKGECKQCTKGCDVCDDKVCIKCTPPLFLAPDNKSCLNTCPDGFKNGVGACAPCLVKECKVCNTNVNVCDECKLPNSLLHKECTPKCPTAGFYLTKNGKNCNDCPVGCATCTEDKCLTCSKGFGLSNGKCLNKCPKGSVMVDGRCDKCNSDKCEICDASTLNCLKCNAGLMIETDKSGHKVCTDCCGDNMFNNNGTCDKCVEHCQECINGKECAVCEKGYLLQGGQCKVRCDKFFVEKDLKCERCVDLKCVNCDPATRKICTVCDSFYFLKNDVCVNDCGTGFFKFEVNNADRLCKPCSKNCDTCNNGVACLVCAKGSVLKNNLCVPECGNGYTLNKLKNTCVQCRSPHCNQCDVNNADVCLTCDVGYFLKDNQCVKTCGENSVAQGGKCVPCTDTNCLTCSPSNICLKCKSPMNLLKGDCVKVCPDGMAVRNGECVSCTDKNCVKCHPEKLNQCLQCKKGFLIDSKGECATECCIGEFVFENTKCKNCGGNCISCLNENQCLECLKPFVLDVNQKCTDKCSEGSVSVNGKCTPCTDSLCNKCSPSDLKICLDCKKGNFLNKGVCVPKCPVTTFTEGLTCQPCSTNCDICTNARKCDKCSNNTVLQGDFCKLTCDIGHKNVNGVCVKCEAFDLVATCEPNKVVKCRNKLYLHVNATLANVTNSTIGVCHYTCPTGTFHDNDNLKCLPCSGNCTQCSNAKVCEKCASNMVRHLGACVSKCPNTFIDVRGECTPCTSNLCNVCSIQNLDNCLVCSGKLVISMKHKCEPACEEGTFLEGTRCQPCDPTCKTCSERSKCLTCKPQFSKDGFKCVSQCPSGFVSKDGNCIACADKDCLICSSKNINECLRCNTKILFEKICIEKCPIGYRLDAKSKQCMACNKNCDSCDEKGCLQCTKGFFASEKDPHYCVNCQDKTEVIENNICKRCKPENCLRCKAGNSLKCDLCDISTVLVNGECLKSCPVGTYKKGQSCLPCTKDCKACHDGESCDLCNLPLFLLDGKCVSKCPPGSVFDGKTKCDRCVQPECNVCDKNLKDCLDCTLSILYKKVCYKNCPDGTAHKGDTCAPCNKGCEICSPDACLKCANGLKLKGAECVLDCGKGYVDTGSRCNHCTDSHCDRCVTEDRCKDCASPYFLNDNGSCVIDCEKGTYNDDKTRTCKCCDKGCETCGKDGHCGVCEKGLLLHDGKCIPTCPDGFAPGEAKCNPCEEKECKICGRDAGECEECKGALALFNKKCLPKCPQGTFMKDKRCHKCDTKCDECRSYEVCDKCKPEFILVNGKCDTNCADGKVNINGKCIPCADENCKNCLSNIQECALCEKPYVLFNKKCLIICPKGQFPDANKNCKGCDHGCLICKGPDVCGECEEGFFLSNNKCVKQCPVGSYGECKEKVCHNCNDACEVCTDSTTSNCKRCSKGFFSSEGACVKASFCGKGTFPEVKTRECTPCKLPFTTECSDAKTATECIRGYELVHGHCTEAKSFFSVIPQSSRLFSQLSNGSQNEVLSFNTFLKGTGVGSDTVTFSFFVREITSASTDVTTDIFETTSLSPSEQIKLQIHDGKCNLVIGTQTHRIGECSYQANTYNWKFFSVTLKRSGNKGIVTIYSQEHKKTPSTKQIEFSMTKTAQFINKDSNLVFNHGKTGNAYELSQFNVLDYAADRNETIQFSKTLPANCDYSCVDCQEKCHKCPSNVEPDSNGLCPAVYIPIMSDFQKVSTVSQMLLKSKITKRLHSNRYGIMTWFYSQNPAAKGAKVIIGKLLYNYKPKTPILTASIKNGHLLVSVDGNRFDYPKLTVSPNKWYHISVMVEVGTIKIILRQRNGEKLTQTETIKSHTRRLTEEVTFNLGDNSKNQLIGSVFDYRLYVNRSPADNEVNVHVNSLKCDVNCDNCSENMKCLSCLPGLKLNINNRCVDEVLGAPIVGLDKISIFRKEIVSVKIPTKLEKSKIFSLSFFYRKKIHSRDNVKPNSFDVLSMVSNGKSHPIIRETLLPNHQSQFSVHSSSKTKTFEENFNDQLYQYIHFVVNVNLNTNVLSISAQDDEVNVIGDITVPHIDSFVFGDKLGKEMNFEIGSAYFYERNLDKENILKVGNTVPIDCDPACLKCDYTNGNCIKCAIKKRGAQKNCPNLLRGYKTAYIYNTFKFDRAQSNAYTNRLKDQFSKDVNSNEYSVIGYFKLFDRRQINKYGNHKFTLFTVANRFGNKHLSPSNNLISLEIRTNKSIASYNWVINDGDNIVVTEIVGLAVLENEWIFVYATVNVVNKTLKFAFRREVAGTKTEVGEIKMKNHPERLQERATLTLFGIGKTRAVNSKYVNGIFHAFYYSPNVKWDTSIIEKFRRGFPIAKEIPCGEDCSKCVFDYLRNKNICLECSLGYEMNNEKCISTKSSDYVLLSDQKSVDYLPPNTNVNIPKSIAGLTRNTLAFYLQRNFTPKGKSNGVLLTAGLLTVNCNVLAGGLTLDFIVKSRAETAHIQIDGIDEDVKSDYGWYLILIQYSKTSIKVIIQNSENKVIGTKSMLLKATRFKIKKLSFDSLNSQYTIYGAHILLNNHYSNALFGFPLPSCQIDCSICVEGKCLQCKYGMDVNQRCNNKPFRTGNFIVQNGSTANRFNLGNTLTSHKPLRSQSFAIYFTFEIGQEFDSLAGKTLLRIKNNRQDTPYDPYDLNDNLYSIKFNKNRSFFIAVGNRNYRSSLKSAIGLTTSSFKSQLESKVFFIALSLDDDLNMLTVLVINNQQVIKDTFSLEGEAENLNLQTTLVFGEGFEKEKLIIENTRFYYERYQNLEFLNAKAVKYLEKYQNACQTNTRLSCSVKEKTGLALIDGVVTPTMTAYTSLLNEIRFIDENNKNVVLNVIEIKNNNSFTLSFWFRRTSYTSEVYGLVRLLNGANKLMSVSHDANVLIVQVFDSNGVQTNGLRLPNLYEKTDGLTWQYIAVSVDSKKNIVQVYNYNKASKRNRFSTNESKTGLSLPATAYLKVVLGFDDVDQKIFSFDISTIVFNHDFFPKDTTGYELYMIRCPRVCQNKCLGKCDADNLCRPADLYSGQAAFKNINFGASAETYAAVPLFRNAKTLQTDVSNYHPSFSNYLIAFEIDVTKMLTSNYKSNKNILVNVNNDRHLCDLKYSDIIPDDTVKYGVISVELRENALRFYIGGNIPNTFVSYHDLVFESDNFKSISKINVQLFVEGEQKIGFLIVFIDDIRILLEIKLAYQSLPINEYTQVFNHPAVSNLRIDFTNPRFNNDYVLNLKTNPQLLRSFPSNLCSSRKNCKKCSMVMKSPTIYCDTCKDGYKMINNMCLKEKTTR